MEPDVPGTLIVLCGLPYSGKTTLARQIEVERPALRLCPDEWIADLLPDGWQRFELDRFRDPVERTQWALAKRALVLGLDVVLEFGSWGRDERDLLRDGAKSIGAGFELRYLDVDLAMLLERLSKRNAHDPAGTFAIGEDELRHWWARIERPTADELALSCPPRGV